ncbi:MAG: aminopeptidase [Bacteroidales bacterium]|nr:aminopeptidase [Bacteroidales bacterium]
MKQTIIIALLLAFFGGTYAQDETSSQEKKEGYQFTVVKQLDATPVKNQYRAGTCWSYSGISFLESELLRMGKGEFDLSEMFIVRHTYLEKAKKYFRMHGILNFGQGGAFHDVTDMIQEYGIMPQEAYTGLNYGTDKDVHGELDAILKAFLDAVIEDNNKTVTPVWFDAYTKVVDTYLGQVPEKFTYKGKEYTPKTFASNLGLDANNYVEIGSYTHHPFYSKFILEVQDNWMWGDIYNVPMDDMISIIDNALENGYTIAWGADVSEKGFSWNNGVAVVPEESKENLKDNEQSKWAEMSERDRAKLFYTFDEPIKEKVITQEMRQEGFDNYQTTDDHGMHITGIAKDQNGNKYYIVKNSWSDKGNDYKGYFYASEAFVKLKTIDFMIHKDALSKDMKKKLSIH